MASTSTTQTLITAYADREPWRIDHDWAMACRDLEEDVTWGLTLYKGLCENEARHQTLVLGGKISLGNSIWDDAHELYEMWLRAARQRLARIDELTERGYAVEGRSEFLLALEEAQAVVGNRQAALSLPPLEELKKAARPENLPRNEKESKVAGT